MKKRLTFTIIIAIILVCTALSVSAILGMYVIDSPSVSQGAMDWCWAADGTSVANYLGKNISIENFVITVKGQLVNEGGSYSDIQDGLSSYNINSTFGYTFSMGDIATQIYSKKPLIAGVAYKYDYNQGHYYVIDGYNTAYDEVRLMDSAIGDHYWQLHSDLMDDGAFEWLISLYDIKE